MAVHFSTSNPRALLKAFDAAVRRAESGAGAWGIAEDGAHYTCVAEQWVAKAWFKPQVLASVLTFNIIRSADDYVTKEAYSHYHAQLVQTFLGSLDHMFSMVGVTSAPSAGDHCTE
jgi:hypothetical protein